MAHRSTILAQLLKLVPRHEFEVLAKRHRKRCQLHSMTRWAQFAALALGQLPNWCGLRDGAHGGRPLKLGAAVLGGAGGRPARPPGQLWAGRSLPAPRQSLPHVGTA